MSANLAKTEALLSASFRQGEHKAFKEHLENEVVLYKFSGSLAYGMELVMSETRTMSDVAPTLKLLLQHGAKWDRDGPLEPGMKTPCHVICQNTGDHHQLLELFVKELGLTSVYAKDNRERTALMYAVRKANVKCAERLIENGADVNVLTDTCGDRYQFGLMDSLITDVVSPLIDSINLMHPKSDCSFNTMMDIFDLLLKSGADVNKPCKFHHRSPIMYAAVLGNVNCVNKLIQKGAKIDHMDRTMHSVSSLAAAEGKLDVLKLLIEDHGVDKESSEMHRGLSLLCRAAGSENIEMVRYLLNLGAKVSTYIHEEYLRRCEICGISVYTHYYNETLRSSDPYMEAISCNEPKVMKLLEEHGCRLYETPEALRWAIRRNSPDVVDYLLSNYKYSLNNYVYDYGFRFVPFNLLHQTFLTDACQLKSVKMIKLLLEHGADPNEQSCTEKCSNAINIAIYEKHVEAIACLIRAGVDVNARSKFPKIGVVLPFEAAVWHEHIYAADMLLASGCSRGVHSLDLDHKLKTRVTPELQELLKEWDVQKNNALPLQIQCRKMILNHLCPQADQKVTELPLPPNVIKYLSIPELDDIVDNPKDSCYVQ